MRYLVDRLLRRRQRLGAVVYRSASCVPLRPRQVGGRSFRRTGLGRRGLDPDDVQVFLDRVAGDLAAAYGAADRARQETDRPALPARDRPRRRLLPPAAPLARPLAGDRWLAEAAGAVRRRPEPRPLVSKFRLSDAVRCVLGRLVRQPPLAV